MFTQTPFKRENHVFRSPQLQDLMLDALRFFNGTPVYELPPATSLASVKSLVQKLSEQPPDVATTRCNPAFRGYQGCLFSKTSVAVAELLAKGSFCA